MIEYRPIQLNGEADAIIIWCSRTLCQKINNEMKRVESVEACKKLVKENVQLYWKVDPEVEWGYLW